MKVRTYCCVVVVMFATALAASNAGWTWDGPPPTDQPAITQAG